MLYSTREAVERRFRAGDDVWAFAFTLQTSKNGRYVFSEPVRGKFTEFDTAVPPPGKRPSSRPRYFVPYNKTGKLVWSRAVTVAARTYADTKAEAVAGFNAKIDDATSWMRKRADEIAAERLPQERMPCPRPIGTYKTLTVYDADDFDVFSAYVLPNLDGRPAPPAVPSDRTVVFRRRIDGTEFPLANAYRFGTPNPYGAKPVILFFVWLNTGSGEHPAAFAIDEDALRQVPGLVVRGNQRYV